VYRHYLEVLDREVGGLLEATDDELAVALSGMNESVRPNAVKAVRAWARFTGSAVGATLRTPRVSSRPQPTASPGQVEAARASVDPHGAERDVRAAVVVALAWATGCRIGELHRLAWEDLDLSTGLATIDRAKTGVGRVVVLTPAAVDWLEAWREVIGRSTDRLFTVTVKTLQGDVERVLGMSPHAFRRGWACHWLRRGGSQASLQRLGGWSSPRMVSLYTQAVGVELAIEEARRLLAG
jgi:integrase